MPSRGHSRSGRFISSKEKARREKLSEENNKRVIDEVQSVQICVGRRIVNISHLAKEMWCSLCDIPLSFRDMVEEIRQGLSSQLRIRCRVCLVIKSISTDTQSIINDNKVYDVNLKVAIGMIDAGIGPRQLNTLFSAINVPPPSENTFKKHERIVGPMLEEVANTSCNEAIDLEKSLTLQSPLNTTAGDSPGVASEIVHSTPAVDIAASYDMGWQKRGTGRNYDSLSGHGSLIGLRSRRVLQFGTRSKVCRKCNAGQEKAEHYCKKNFEGSAKSMEADVAVQLVKSSSLNDGGVQVAVLIGDDDSSTISAVQRSSSCSVQKWSDINHAKKALGNMLYNLRRNFKEINPTVIKYLKRCFSYALGQNKGNEEGTRFAIQNITNHAFDDHKNCGHWCSYLVNPLTYRHKGLANGEGLKGDILRGELEKIFTKFAVNAAKLAPCGSSQVNESFNMVVASKAPKYKHYGGSESLDFRVASAVCQKNIGTSYLIDLNKKLGISPGHNSAKYRKRIDIKRMQRSIKCATLCFKRRRLFLNKVRGQRALAGKAKEGMTYQKDMALAITCSNLTSQRTVSGQCKYVFFDIETTGFGKNAEICQLAGECEDQKYSSYILPLKEVSQAASEVNKLVLINKRLFHNGLLVEAKSLEGALLEFLNFMEGLNEKVIMVGYNILKFDCYYILRDITACMLKESFQNVVVGFVDIFPLMKVVLPKRKSYKLAVIAEEYLGRDISQNAHDASWDVKLVEGLLKKLNISYDMLKDKAIPLAEYEDREFAKSAKRNNILSLQCLKNVISGRMISKMAACDINWPKLCDTYKSVGEDGVYILMCEDVNGKPRVTTNKKIIMSLLHFLQTSV